MKLELGVLGVAEKLVKDVVQLQWRNFEIFIFIFPTGYLYSKQPNFGFKEF
jgi:hypothetical protein